jgi:hypothetical protein
MHDPEKPAPAKRNCGRSGPTSPEGRAASSKNSTKHGACSRTLILPGESEEAWERLLARYVRTYQPAEDSLEYDFVPQNRPSRMAPYPHSAVLRFVHVQRPRPFHLQLDARTGQTA